MHRLDRSLGASMLANVLMPPHLFSLRIPALRSVLVPLNAAGSVYTG